MSNITQRPNIKVYDNTGTLAAGMYNQFRELFTGQRSQNRPLHIALAGGSTPLAFYEFLAKRPVDDIHWKTIHLWWGDERCVPPDHSDSNYRMVREALLDHIDIGAQNIHRIRGESDPDSETIRYGKEIEENIPLSPVGLPVFDLILLGIGEDGHTASIFPDSDFSADSISYCVVTRHPGSGQKRITLTMPVLNQAKHVAFMVSGPAKADVVSKILKKQIELKNLPAVKVIPVDGILFWFLDRAAASHLDK
ncbi:MAG: 6-phosphogluconolactonase [Calditrichales bacterium]|nr:MAG: 6-phosphogluconolactonase [Calditrichales bacterium]